MAEEWIETMEESDPNSLYALHNATVTEELKEQDREFYRHLNYMYVLPEKQFLEEFQEWVIELTNDQKHLDTPVQYVIREFMRNRRLYTKYFEKFAEENESAFEPGEKQKWADLIVKVFDFTIYTFVDHAEMNAKQRIKRPKRNDIGIKLTCHYPEQINSSLCRLSVTLIPNGRSLFWKTRFKLVRKDVWSIC